MSLFGRGASIISSFYDMSGMDEEKRKDEMPKSPYT